MCTLAMNFHLLTIFFLAGVWMSSIGESTAETVFECDFETDNCGLVNDARHEAKWERKQLELGGRTSYVMVLEAGGKSKQIAKLLSPILDEHWSGFEGCLSLELFTRGDGIRSFRVERQDASGVFRVLGVHTEVKNWRQYSLQVDVEDYVRFVFEAHVNPVFGGTLVAIDNIAFKTEECTDI